MEAINVGFFFGSSWTPFESFRWTNDDAGAVSKTIKRRSIEVEKESESEIKAG